LVIQLRGTDPAEEKAALRIGVTAELPELVREGKVGQGQDCGRSNLKSA